MSKTFLFQAIQFSQTALIQAIYFSISMQLVLLNPSGANIPGQSWPGSNGNEHHWKLTIRLFSVISRTFVWGGGLTSLQRCSRCILLTQPTRQFIRIRFKLVVLYGMSTRVGYLMPNPAYPDTEYMICKQLVCR